MSLDNLLRFQTEQGAIAYLAKLSRSALLALLNEYHPTVAWDAVDSYGHPPTDDDLRHEALLAWQDSQ